MVKLENGFETDISHETLDDWDLITAINDMEKGNSLRIVDVAYKLLGKDGVERLKECIRKESDGKVSMTAMSNAITEIFSKLGDTEKK